ncbi:LGFP repeat-containing protein [Corynebacterium aurimucosum]
MKKMTRRFAAGIAAATLSLGVVACSDAEDAAKDAGDAAQSAASDATDAAGSAAKDAKESMKDSESADSSEAEGSEGADSSESDSAESKDGSGADGDKESVSTANGDVEVPSDFAQAIKEKAAEWGDPESIETTDKGSVATFAKDKLLAFGEGDGTQPIIGKIAETWTEEGGLESKVGLPTGPEQAEGNGWVQEFTNGTISWMQGESGEYEATIN